MKKPLNFKQELVSLFGQPVAENPTQVMIESAFRQHNLDWRYLTIEVAPENLGAAVRGMRAMNFRGGNCTIPHKVAVIEHLDRLGESAALMGAVNCIVRRGHELVGENTDGKGFLVSLRELVDPRGLEIAILGAGGAARAIAVELALAGAKRLILVNRSLARGAELARMLQERLPAHVDFQLWQGNWRIPRSTQVLVQATSIGLFPNVDEIVPLDLASLRSDLIVADVIPNPPLTRLLRDARAAKATTIDGLGMLVQQGVIGFEHWTGIRPDPNVMRRALEEVFGA